MAYGLKYQSLQRDRHDILWTNNISEKDKDAVTPIQLVGAGDAPMRFEFLNRSDDIFDPIKASRLAIRIWADQMFKFSAFYSVDKMQHLIETSQGASTYWKGYVDPGQYKEAYGPVPYEFELIATDGLPLLNDIPYQESEGVPYNGMKLASEIILNILAKIGHTSFTEFINIYSSQMSATVSYSPFDQMKINTDVFRDMNCDEVLEEILGIFNANIRMAGGGFCIFRPMDLVLVTLYGRIFTGPTTKNTISITTSQYIRRTGHNTSLLQVSPSEATAVSPARKITIRHDYGNKESWLDNYRFKSNTYSRDTHKFTDWEHEDDVGVNPISDLIPGETEGLMFNSHNPTGQHLQCIKQSFGDGAVATNDDFEFSFEYLFYNYDTRLIEDAVFYIEIKNNAGTRWLKATTLGDNEITDIEWTTTGNFIAVVADVPPGLMEWKTFRRKIPGLPVNGGFTIRIYASYENELAIFPAIKNIKIYTTSSGISLRSETRLVQDRKFRLFGGPRKKTVYYFPTEPRTVVKREYVKTNSVSSGPELEYDFLLGDVTDAEIDNVTEQFSGAIAAWVGGVLSPTSSWHSRDAAENLPLLQLICNERALLLSRPRQFVDMTIMEITKAATTLNLLGNLQDSINPSSGYLRCFYANRGTFYVKNRQWKFDLVEVGRGDQVGEAPGEVTTDSTQITVDTTQITVDQT